MDRFLADLSKTIDPGLLGRRIRAARVAAGLTQTELSKGLASAAYFSRIESGDRRPDAQLLERIAAKLQVPLEELLSGVSRDQLAEWELGRDYAELALQAGDSADALQRSATLLQTDGIEQAQALHTSIRRVHALALEASGDLDGAIHALEGLVDQEPHDQPWLRDLIALSRCYRYAGDLSRAIDVGESAKDAIAANELDGLAETVQLTLTVAAAYFLRGDTAYAARICRQAIEQAEARGTATEQASAYWNASVVESRRGNTASALPLAKKALAVFEVGDDARNLARLRTQVAIMELRLSPPDVASAKEMLSVAERELEWSSASPTDRADNTFALAQANYLSGDVELAKQQINDGLELVRGQAPLSAASAMVLRGQIAFDEGDLPGARASYREAIAQLTAAGADRVAGEVWFELAAALDRVGEGEEAKGAYRNAAASAGLAVRAGAEPAAALTAAAGPSVEA